MTETKLISVRVPVDLLNKIDELAKRNSPIKRSGVIVNCLQALTDAADGGTLFLAATWPCRRKKNYVITAQYSPDANTTSKLSSSNLITP